jgi:hypothetical protein
MQPHGMGNKVWRKAAAFAGPLVRHRSNGKRPGRVGLVELVIAEQSDDKAAGSQWVGGELR